jgi:SAM-dependent methyltransferase
MKFVTTPSGHRLLLIWRADTMFHPPERGQLADEWNQVHFTSAPTREQPILINHELNEPLPLPDGWFDGIYSRHIIEHLSPAANERFMRDIYRLLKLGGIYRVSTPDLEFHATEYLKCLHEQAASASAENYTRYHWAVCNLIDQCVRELSGGEILKAMRRGEFTLDYLRHMNGDSFDPFLQPSPAAPSPPPARARLIRAVKNPMIVLRKIAGGIRRRLRPRPPAKSYMELTHERNLWLFDRISLDRLFTDAGFRNVTAKDFFTSSIPAWKRYNFDESAYGEYPLEPSLYMEGTK